MTDIPLQFSIIHTNSMMMMKKSKQIPSNNLFNNQQGSHEISSNNTLPIITLSTFSDLKKKFIRMATNKSTIQSHIPIDSRTAQMKSRTLNSNRLNTSTIPKSSLSYPTTIIRPTISHRSNNQQQQNARFLYIVNTPMSSHRTISARITNNNLSPPPPLQQQQQQQQQQSILGRPHSQYGHFLAYLRRQSLARIRRKQQQEEGNTDNVETTITLNLNKHSSSQTFQSTSNHSLSSLTTDNTLSMPTISIAPKRAEKPLSSYRQLQRSITTYRLNAYRQSPLINSKNSIDDPLLSLTSSSLLITPRNSVVDDATMSPKIKPPYDLHLNDDMLNYCYISDENDVKYQGEMLSTAV